MTAAVPARAFSPMEQYVAHHDARGGVARGGAAKDQRVQVEVLLLRTRYICRQAAAECKSKIARVLASAKTVAAVERLAKADRRLAATVDQWDADPWALNTPLGVLDLRTGKLRPPARRTT